MLALPCFSERNPWKARWREWGVTMMGQRFLLTRFEAVVGMALSMTALAFSAHAGHSAHADQDRALELSIPGEATFLHAGQQGTYRTRISVIGDWEFVEDPSGSLRARLRLSPDSPAGLGSWEGPDATGIGPTGLYLARDGTSEADLRQWRQAGGRSGRAPEPIVPLAPVPTEQGVTRAFRNSSVLVAPVFLRRCGGDEFLHYGDLTIEAGALLFAFRVDETGDVHVDISAPEVGLDVNVQRWAELQSACDPKGILPALAVDGFSQNLNATSRLDDPVAGSLTDGFESLSRTLKILKFQRRLDEKSALKLMTIAERARLALQRTRPEQSARHLETFVHRVEILGGQGRLGPKGAELLTSRAIELRDELTGFGAIPLPEPDPALAACPGSGSVDSCRDTLSTCSFTVLHVNAGTTADEPDGTRARPFPTIGAALARAEATDLCGVSLRVGPGVYDEDLSITRHTKILGDPESVPFAVPFVVGSVNNAGPHFLELRDLILSAPGDAPATALSVTHPCASTRLDDVAVLGYRGLGLHQESGSFAFVDVHVSDTRAIQGKPSAGTGVLLTCGVVGRMTDVTLRGNESAGLIATGAGTDVEAFDLVATGTRVHPDYIAQRPTGFPWGAVHVRDEARLVARGFRLAHNWVVGIHVDVGAEALFEQGRVARTLGLDRVAPGSAAPPGGMNAVANRGAALEMWDFVSTRADLCGAVVANDAQLDLVGRQVLDPSGDPRITSEVSHSTIGACVGVPGYDVGRLFRGVPYRNNETNLDSVDLVIPELPDVLP